MRPTYQKQHDLDNELSVMDSFADVMNDEVYFWHKENNSYAPPENKFGFKKSPDFSCYDYMLTCDNVGLTLGLALPLQSLKLSAETIITMSLIAIKYRKEKSIIWLMHLSSMTSCLF